jgi:DNA-binding MarR family transcriptional regulator
MTKTAQADLADELRPRLLRISQALRRETKDLPLTRAQSAVLSALLIGDPMRLSDLARAEAVSLPTMTQVVNRMVQLGWVVRTAPMGTLNNVIEITEEGRKVAAQAAELRNAVLMRRMGFLSAEEQKLLWELLPVIDKMFAKAPWKYDPVEQEKREGGA